MSTGLGERENCEGAHVPTLFPLYPYHTVQAQLG